jgi:DNA-binding GntR family transcriptional regulator
VTDQIRFAILSGTLIPGEELREQALAHWLGVSATPVRVALARLAGEGMVEIDGKDKRVAPSTANRPSPSSTSSKHSP